MNVFSWVGVGSWDGQGYTRNSALPTGKTKKYAEFLKLHINSKLFQFHYMTESIIRMPAIRLSMIWLHLSLLIQMQFA